MGVLLGVAFWLRAGRASFLPVSLLSVAIGTAVARRGGFGVDLAALGATVAGVAAAHLAVNILNDYADAAGTDRINEYRSAYSGGSGVIQAGLVTRGGMLRAATFLGLVAVAIGVALAIARGPVIWLLMAAGAAIGIGYSAPPMRLMARGWGEVAAGFAFGPLLAMGAAYVQGGCPAATAALWPGIPAGLLVSAILTGNELPDFAADAASGKRNLVVRRGVARGARLHAVFAYAGLLSAPLGAAAGLLPPLAWLAVLALPLAAVAARSTRLYATQPRQLHGASRATILLHVMVSAVLLLSYLAAPGAR